MSKVVEGLKPHLFEGIPQKKKISKKIPEKSRDFYGKHPGKGNKIIPYISEKEYDEVWEQ